MSSAPILARQPIFDRVLNVVGYELLYRSQTAIGTMSSKNNGDMMTAQVMIDAFILGIERLTGDRTLFINADRKILVGEVPIVFPPGKTVIEVPNGIEFDSKLLEGCQSLIKRGFKLALDNFSWFEGAQELLKLVAFIKVDVLLGQPKEIATLVRVARKFGVKSVALKVESWEELETCTQLGFDYFQGYVLSRPQIIEGKTLAPSHMTNLRLASELNNANSSLEAVEQIVRRDPALSYRVFQAASEGSYYGIRRTVRTLNDALIILGWRRLQAWVTLMLLVEPETIPSERVSSVLVRARLCELIAAHIDPEMSNAAYTTGLLSGLDVLLGIPTEEAIKELPLDAEIIAAILHMEGILGKILTEAEFLQLGIGDFGDGTGEADGGLLDAETLQRAYVEALEWGDAMANSLVNSNRPAANHVSNQ